MAISSSTGYCSACLPSKGWWTMNTWNSSTASECRSVSVLGTTLRSRTISGAMNRNVPATSESLLPLMPTLSLSQTRVDPVAGSKNTLPKLMSR